MRVLTHCALQGRTALIPFVTAGDPSPEATVPVMHALVEAGADLIELGMPFSDPMADGPVIQHADERALRRRVGVADILGWVREFRAHDTNTPVVLMGYLNPVEIHGIERFAREAADAGVDGVLVVDCPIEEDATLRPLRDAGLRRILLAAPTTSDLRLERAVRGGRRVPVLCVVRRHHRCVEIVGRRHRAAGRRSACSCQGAGRGRIRHQGCGRRQSHRGLRRRRGDWQALVDALADADDAGRRLPARAGLHRADPHRAGCGLKPGQRNPVRCILCH